MRELKVWVARAIFLAANGKARDQRQKHTARLPATTREQTILAGTGVGEAIPRDYQSRQTCFGDFADRWWRSLQQAKDYDNALCDWADFAYLIGEGRTAENMSEGAIPTLRLCYWRKKAPRQSRLPMPELYMWVFAVFLLHFKSVALALYLVGLFASYLRPMATVRICAQDVIDPESSIPGSNHVLIVSSFEKGVVAKCGYCDETVL